MSQTAEHPHEQLSELIKDIRFAMFTTRHRNGHLHSRPMTVQNPKVDTDRLLWFFMSKSGEPVADLQADPTVNISFADPGRDSYVSVSGQASLVDDPARKEALWSKANEAWFKGGVNDPDLALVRVEVVHADFWDIKESKITQLFKMAKAALTGQEPQLGEHGEVHMR